MEQRDNGFRTGVAEPVVPRQPEAETVSKPLQPVPAEQYDDLGEALPLLQRLRRGVCDTGRRRHRFSLQFGRVAVHLHPSLLLDPTIPLHAALMSRSEEPARPRGLGPRFSGPARPAPSPA